MGRKRVCGKQCQNAKGHRCHCVCSGFNHGKNRIQAVTKDKESDNRAEEIIPGDKAMTIDEAIKVLERKRANLMTPNGSRATDALGLGIEALKLVKWERGKMPSPDILLLPGETKE